MNELITSASLQFKCPVNYNEMQPVEGGRFCNVCQKKVHDFTNANAAYFAQIMAESSGGVCGRFNVEQLRPQKPKHSWMKWLSAAAVLLGISLPLQKAEAQVAKQTKIDSNRRVNEPPMLGEVVVVEKKGTPKQKAIEDTSKMFGLIRETTPEYPGGYSALMKFVMHNMKLKSPFSGRLVMRFMVEADGSVNDLEILKGGNKEVNTEIERVFKLLPKWKPAIRLSDQKPIRTQFMMPITIH